MQTYSIHTYGDMNSSSEVHPGINCLRKAVATRIKFIFLCLLLTTSYLGSIAKERQEIKKPTLGLHFLYNDFKTAQLINANSLGYVLQNHLWNKPQNMEGGFGLDYLQGLTNHVDLIGSLNGSWVDYLLPDNTLYGSSNFLLDINAGAHFKLLSDQHIFTPFLIGKACFSSYQNTKGFSLAPGIGFQVNMFKEIFILATFEYRSALNNRLSNQLYYSIGIATNIVKRKSTPLKIEESAPIPIAKEIVTPPKNLIIKVVDEATRQPLPYVTVVVSGPDGKKLNGSTDENGSVAFNALTAAEYEITGMLNNINTSVQNISKEIFLTDDQQISLSLTHNDPRYTLSGIVINKTKNLPVGGAEVLVDNTTKSSLVTQKSHEGDGVFRVQLEAGSDFTVVGKKASYISNIEKISTKGLNRSATLYVKLELAIEEAKVGQSIQLGNIYFETGKATLNTAVSSDLDRLIQFLKDNPTAKLEIQGHTDNVGSLGLNNRLSQARANSVVDYLTKNGIDKSRLMAKGYGPTVPVADNSTAEGKTKNRRVVMKVLN